MNSFAGSIIGSCIGSNTVSFFALGMMKTKNKIAKPKSKPKPKKVIKTLDLTITDKEIDAIVNDKPIEKKVNIKGSSTDDKLKAFLDAMIKK